MSSSGGVTGSTGAVDTISHPAVTVVVPCRNEVRHIEAALGSILASEAPPGGFEVVVADGMSDDGTREVLMQMAAADPRVRVVDNPQRGTSQGLNAAIKAARGDVILRMDAHTHYAPDYIRRCLEVLQESGADNVGGPALTEAHGYTQRAIAAAYHSRFAVGNSVFHQADYEGPADTVPYGCYYRSRLLELGLFDEELVRNQDDELNFRLLLAGGRIWQSPRIRSWYSPRDSLGQLARQYFQYGYWKVRVMQKHGRHASLRHLVPGGFVLALVLSAILSVVLPGARAAFLALSGFYLTALVGASLVTAARSGWGLLPLLPAVFACYHFSYGVGYLLGVWDFLLRRRAGRFTNLTRR